MDLEGGVDLTEDELQELKLVEQLRGMKCQLMDGSEWKIIVDGGDRGMLIYQSLKNGTVFKGFVDIFILD